jgi:ABC-type Na+ efflux pump permease subunit
MHLSLAGRATVKLALALLGVAVIGVVVHTLAAQGPSSPWWLGILPGPVAQLRDASALLGALLLAAAPYVSAREGEREPWALVVALYVGAAVVLVTLAAGAMTGMYGEQIEDPRVASRWLFRARSLGELILLGALVAFARRAWKAR